MANNVEIILDAQDAGTVRAWLNAKNSVAAYEAQLQKLDGAQTKNTKSAEVFDRAAQAIFANTRTPMERYEQKLKELGDLYLANKVNSETYDRALKQLDATLRKEDGTEERDKARSDAARKGWETRRRNQADANREAELARRREEAAAIAQDRREEQAAVRSLSRQRAQAYEGIRLSESMATAQEKHNAKIAHYDTLLKSSAIDQQTFNRAVHASQKELRDSGEAGKALGGIKSQLVSLLAGYVSIAGAIGLWKQAAAEALQLTEEAASKQDDLVRRYRVQAGLSAIQGDTAKKSIYGIAEKTAVASESAFEASTALVSTGFSAKEAQGPALEAMLKLLSAQSLNPKKSADAGTLAEAASMYLASQGKEKTGENLHELAVAIQGLKETKLKITDIQDLAKEGAGLKGLVGYQEQIANFAMLNDVMGAGEAATGLRNVVGRMATAGAHKSKVDALAEIGLTPADIDMVGETFQQALAKIEAGLKTVPEEERKGLKTKLFEERGIVSYELLAANQDLVNKYVQQQQRPEILEEDWGVGAAGRNAALRRQALRLEQQRADRDQQTALYRNALEEMERARGTGEWQIAYRKIAFDTMSYFQSPETSMRAISGSDILGVGTNGQDGLWIPNNQNMQKAKSQIERDLGSEQKPAVTVPDGETMDSLNQKGRDVTLQLREAQRSGNTALAVELKKVEELLFEQLQVMKKQQAVPNVTVTIPGNSAPAKPVAASAIGTRS